MARSRNPFRRLSHSLRTKLAKKRRPTPILSPDRSPEPHASIPDPLPEPSIDDQAMEPPELRDSPHETADSGSNGSMQSNAEPNPNGDDAYLLLLARLLAIAASMTAASLVASRASRGEMHHGSSSTGDNSFLGFVDSLLSGEHSQELSQAIFSENVGRRSFFRMFRFPEEDSGLIPVLIIGVRAADSDPHHEDDRNGENIDRDDTTEHGDNHDFDGDHILDNRLLSDMIDEVGLLGLNTTRSQENSSSAQSTSSGPPLSRQRRLSDTTNNSSSSQQGPRRARQSWVIYVVGSAFQSSHPIFNTPSLLSENPSYEDILFLESLLGHVRPQTATQQQVDQSGGVTVVDSQSPLLDDSCAICLQSYLEDDECRALPCNHNYHRQCIDKWLTNGHNSCPMCRAQGVSEI